LLKKKSCPGPVISAVAVVSSIYQNDLTRIRLRLGQVMNLSCIPQNDFIISTRVELDSVRLLEKDWIEFEANRSNIGPHLIKCVAVGPTDTAEVVAELLVVDDYWTNVIFSSLISISCFITAVILVAIVLSVRVTILRKNKRKKVAKFTRPTVYDVATGLPTKQRHLPGRH